MSLSPIPTEPNRKTTTMLSAVRFNKTERIVLGVVGVANAKLYKLLHPSLTRV